MYFRIGVRAHDYGRHTPEELARRISEAGFCSVQLAISKAITGLEDDIGKFTPGFAATVRQAFDKYGVDISILGCYIEPVHPDPEVRARHVRRFKEHLRFARAFGGLAVGTETTLYRAEESGREKAFQILTQTVGALVEEAEKCSAVVAVEPVAAHTMNSPALTARLIDIIGSEHLQVIFDPVNLITADIARDHSAMLDEAFDAFGERIMALHCKDIDFGPDGRLHEVLLGQGLVDYDRLFGWLGSHRPGLALLREGADPATAAQDIAFLKSYTERF